METKVKDPASLFGSICGDFGIKQEGNRVFIIGTIAKGDLRGIRVYLELSKKERKGRFVSKIGSLDLDPMGAKDGKGLWEDCNRTETLLRLCRKFRRIDGESISRLISEGVDQVETNRLFFYVIFEKRRMDTILTELGKQADLRRKIVSIWPALLGREREKMENERRKKKAKRKKRRA